MSKVYDVGLYAGKYANVKLIIIAETVKSVWFSI